MTRKEIQEKIGRSEEIWDATKLGAYLRCMRLGHLGFEKHLVSKIPSEALAFGLGFHKAVEVWTSEQLETPGELERALDIGKEAFLEVWEKELPQEQREKLEFEGDRRSYGNFCRLFEAYCRKFPIEMFDKIIAQEIPFTLYLGETPQGRKISWSGVLDRVVKWQGGIYYVDIKTSGWSVGDKFFEKFRYNCQMLGYAWAGKELMLGDFDGIMIHGVEVKAPPKTSRAKTVDQLISADIIPIHEDHIEEWKRMVLWKIDEIHRSREAGFHPPAMGEACEDYGGCRFRSVCFAPEVLREKKMEEFYEVREWNPLNRGT